jgi:hypothetical protein
MSVALTSKFRNRGSNLPSSDTKDEKFNEGPEVTVSETSSELGLALQESRFWFQRKTKYDPEAIATLVRPHIPCSQRCTDVSSPVCSMTPRQQRSISLGLTGMSDLIHMKTDLLMCTGKIFIDSTHCFDGKPKAFPYYYPLD